jgi:TRAP-type mannitol/chloroaromatic compound transport system permease large subunit
MFICFIRAFHRLAGDSFHHGPYHCPIAEQLGFDKLWFAMMICINLQMSFMTPPFAYAIFYLRGAADPALEVTTKHIVQGVIPYVILIAIALLFFIFFPDIILWLPTKML